MARPSRESHAIELTLFLWHIPDDATEGVAEHSSRLQPSIKLHAPVTTLISSFPGYLESRRGKRQSSSSDQGFDRRIQSRFEQGAAGWSSCHGVRGEPVLYPDPCRLSDQADDAHHSTRPARMPSWLHPQGERKIELELYAQMEHSNCTGNWTFFTKQYFCRKWKNIIIFIIIIIYFKNVNLSAII